jgi:amino acid transporter
MGEIDVAKKEHYLTTFTVAMLTAAAIITSVRGFPLLADEEMTMFAYIAFATLLFLIPAALVSAELGSAFADQKGGVYTWVGKAFGQEWGFVAIWLQWLQNVVWYPTGLAFAAAAAAFTIGNAGLAGNRYFVGVFCIASYWLATLIALSGTKTFARVASNGFLVGTVFPGLILLGGFLWWAASGHSLGWEHATGAAVTTVSGGETHLRWFPPLNHLNALVFLSGIILLFAGVEVQAVHVREMKNPAREYPLAMLIASAISALVFTLGALSVAGIVRQRDISLLSGDFVAFGQVFGAWGIRGSSPSSPSSCSSVRFQVFSHGLPDPARGSWRQPKTESFLPSSSGRIQRVSSRTSC